VLGLHVPVYQPQVHYQQVRDNWVGLRNPDGRWNQIKRFGYLASAWCQFAELNGKVVLDGRPMSASAT
jgi:hypothetical protein